MTTTERVRTLNAMLFFALHTRHCVAKKLFKLLYLLDIESVRQTGRAVTGLQYAAYSPGPVPPGLAQHLEHVSGELARFIRTKPFNGPDGKPRQEVLPAEGANFDDGAFTPRYLSIMHSLATRFADIEVDAIEVSDFDNGAWIAALRRGREQDILLEEALMDTDPMREAKLSALFQHRESTRTQSTAF